MWGGRTSVPVIKEVTNEFKKSEWEKFTQELINSKNKEEDFNKKIIETKKICNNLIADMVKISREIRDLAMTSDSSEYIKFLVQKRDSIDSDNTLSLIDKTELKKSINKYIKMYLDRMIA